MAMLSCVLGGVRRCIGQNWFPRPCQLGAQRSTLDGCSLAVSPFFSVNAIATRFVWGWPQSYSLCAFFVSATAAAHGDFFFFFVSRVAPHRLLPCAPMGAVTLTATQRRHRRSHWQSLPPSPSLPPSHALSPSPSRPVTCHHCHRHAQAPHRLGRRTR